MRIKKCLRWLLQKFEFWTYVSRHIVPDEFLQVSLENRIAMGKRIIGNVFGTAGKTEKSETGGRKLAKQSRSERRRRGGGSMLRLSETNARGLQRVAIVRGEGQWHRIEKEAALGRIAPAGYEITLLIPAASFVSTPFRFPRKPLLFTSTSSIFNGRSSINAIARRCRNENFSGRLPPRSYGSPS